MKLGNFIDEVIKLLVGYVGNRFDHVKHRQYYLCDDPCLGAINATDGLYECSLHITDGPDNMMDEHEWFTLHIIPEIDNAYVRLFNGDMTFDKMIHLVGDDYQKYLKLKLGMH